MDLGLHGAVNATWSDFKYWINVTEMECVAASATSPVVTLEYHDWTRMFTALIRDMTDEFNLRWAEPRDLKAKGKIVPMLAGIVKNTILSPFVVDEFLMAGFKVITDPDGPMTAFPSNFDFMSFLQ